MLPYLDKMCNVLHCIHLSAACNTTTALTTQRPLTRGPSTWKLTGDSPTCIQLYAACTGCTNKAYVHELELPSHSTTRVSQVGRALQLKQFLAVAEPVHSKQAGQGKEQNFCPTRQAVAIHPDIVLFSQSQPNCPKPTPTTLFNLQDRSFLVGNGSPRNRERRIRVLCI